MDAIEIYENLEKSKRHDKKYVYDLLRSKDIEVQGLIYSLLEKNEFFEKIYPIISQKEHTEIFIKYLLLYLFECMEKNPDGEFSHSSYIAAYDLNNWIKYYYCCMKDMDTVGKIISLLKEKYLAGTDDMRTCLECGVIEHVFEEKDIQPLFSQWKHDPILSIAYKHAKEWAGSQPNED